MKEQNKNTKTTELSTKQPLFIDGVMLSALRLKFSELIGSKFNDELKLIALDWMLNTGRKHKQQYGRWAVIGISQFLFDYSANESNTHSLKLPKKISDWSLYFDAIFSRAIYQIPNKAIKEWRNEERIIPNKYRILKKNMNIPNEYLEEHKYLSWLISKIYDFEKLGLKKEFAHPDYLERTEPEITKISIYTCGNGWIVKYCFSFKTTEGSAWQFEFKQKENESLWEFFGRVFDELQLRVVAEA